EYVNNLDDPEVRDYINSNIEEYIYELSVDKQVYVDYEFVIGIECKAYAENAMLKRMLVDFSLLKTIFPNISCYLFQLESQLGGDYSEIRRITYGSKPTHTLMSYFPDVRLKIVTFLKGERKVDKPIHKSKYFKPLDRNQIKKAISLLKEDLKRYLPGKSSFSR
ncbi:MAG: hypothetical protein N3A62_04540, partial [Thermodesulfovibrionales bacterium]|nr:hypothetical protein [Thermodesulfovibrionales bacterium]